MDTKLSTSPGDMFNIRPIIAFVALLIGTLSAVAAVSIFGSNEDPATIPVRIRNESKIDFKNVVVGGKLYGDIHHGMTTGYQLWRKVYQYSSVSLVANGQTLRIQPEDYVGETPLGDGHFTFVLTISEGNLDIRAESDHD